MDAIAGTQGAQVNQLASLLGKLNILPRPLRRRALTALARRVVPYVGTSRLVVEELSRERVAVAIPNRKIVRNHIGSVHAAAVTLAAESASGFVVGLNLPDSRLPLVKSMKLDFKKRVRGTVRAAATLTDEQRRRMQTEERGDFLVETHIVDDSGEEPVLCEMIWAWVPNTGGAGRTRRARAA